MNEIVPAHTIGAYALSEAGSGSDAFALATRATERATRCGARAADIRRSLGVARLSRQRTAGWYRGTGPRSARASGAATLSSRAAQPLQRYQ